MEYHQLLRLGRRGWWWAPLGVLALVALFFAAQVGLGLAATIALILDGTSADRATRMLSGDPVTPMYLALVNLSWAAMIPLSWLVLLAVHGLRPGLLASVARRIRWRWLATCVVLALVTLLLTVLVGSLLPATGADGDVGGELNSFTTTTRNFLLVVVFLTPLQAAGEEYAFRGYLTQAFGSLASATWGRTVAVVVPAFLFALAHGLGQDLPVFVDRFAFGLVAGYLVIRTGGLEAGIAMHVLNNFFAFGIALAYSDMTTALNPDGGSWWSLPSTLTQSLVYLGLTTWWMRRTRLSATAPGDGCADVLVPPDGRV